MKEHRYKIYASIALAAYLLPVAVWDFYLESGVRSTMAITIGGVFALLFMICLKMDHAIEEGAGTRVLHAFAFSFATGIIVEQILYYVSYPSAPIGLVVELFVVMTLFKTAVIMGPVIVVHLIYTNVRSAGVDV